MSWSETLVKIVFFARIRKARQIGEAAELIGQGRAEETLEILTAMERRIPPYLGHLFFLTRGRALDELGRSEEAEQTLIAAVFAKEGATVAHIHLAVLCGRQRRFDDARDWLRRIREDDEAAEDLLEQADELETMLDDVESGRRLEEIQDRARRFADQHELGDLEPTEALRRLDAWIDTECDGASEECDELACYLGELAARENDGRWVVSLSLEESFVENPDGAALRPFDVVGARLGDDETGISNLADASEFKGLGARDSQE